MDYQIFYFLNYKSKKAFVFSKCIYININNILNTIINIINDYK